MARGEIELSKLTKQFAEVTAVDGIDLQIPAGEFFSLLGPSGCGKTTTLRMIAGFEQPTSGEILLDGTDVAYTPPHQRDVNTVFQNYALFPHLNVYDNIAYGLKRAKRPKAEIRERVGKALELVQLPGYEGRRSSQLRGGCRPHPAGQRARAIRTPSRPTRRSPPALQACTRSGRAGRRTPPPCRRGRCRSRRGPRGRPRVLPRASPPRAAAR